MSMPSWRQTPLAIFPSALGFMGLAVAWNNTSNVFGFVPSIVGTGLLMLSAAIFLWFFLHYIIKVATRPSVVLEDIKTPPARGALSAMSMGVMLLALVMMHLGAAQPAVWMFGVALHFVTAALVVLSILKSPPETRQFTFFQLLTFVGLIVAPLAGNPLGFHAASNGLTMLSLVAVVVVLIGTALSVKKRGMPPPMRPTVAIILAPLSLFAISFGMMGSDLMFDLLYWLATAAFAIMLLLSRWMMSAGFTPLWGAFTFPVAAFINMQLMAIGMGYGLIATLGVITGLLVGTPLIMLILLRTIQLWKSGMLATKTGAATA